jgi:polar amino acid transport system substrate-binding protein
MRKALVLLLLALSASPALAANCPTIHSGQLTIGTDNPAYPPWFGGSPPKGSKWKVSDPASGKGYESAVAYAVAGRLGFARSAVQWTYVPFNRSFAPGSKSFDFDINQISYTPARAKVVTFSKSYYDVNQALVVLAGSKIAAAKSIAALRGYKLGAELGTTSYGYIKDTIKPSKQPAVYQQNAAAIQALKNKQIDGLVVDLPTAFYVTGAQVDNSVVVGQFPAPTGADAEHFSVVLPLGSSVTNCVNSSIAAMKADGSLDAITKEWLSDKASAPVLQP